MPRFSDLMTKMHKFGCSSVPDSTKRFHITAPTPSWIFCIATWQRMKKDEGNNNTSTFWSKSTFYYLFILHYVLYCYILFTCRSPWWCWFCVRWSAPYSQRTGCVLSTGSDYRSPGRRTPSPHQGSAPWSYGAAHEPGTPAASDPHCTSHHIVVIQYVHVRSAVDLTPCWGSISWHGH